MEIVRVALIVILLKTITLFPYQEKEFKKGDKVIVFRSTYKKKPECGVIKGSFKELYPNVSSISDLFMDSKGVSARLYVLKNASQDLLVSLANPPEKMLKKRLANAINGHALYNILCIYGVQFESCRQTVLIHSAWMKLAEKEGI